MRYTTLRLVCHATIALAGLMLAACSAPEVPTQLPFAEPGVTFTVTPAGPGCAPDGTYRSAVNWDVPLSMSSKIEIQIGADERKVFARSDESMGTEQTDAWTSDGMVFILLDRDTDMLLAAVAAGPGRCEAAGTTAGQ
ncbi:hypothetical protein [Lysobacter sp. A421]